jgi:hypothetical protein
VLSALTELSIEAASSSEFDRQYDQSLQSAQALEDSLEKVEALAALVLSVAEAGQVQEIAELLVHTIEKLQDNHFLRPTQKQNAIEDMFDV